jgi:hypothetical protein
MIEDIFPKNPFFERREFKGSLSRQQQTADGLQFVVQYPLTKEGEIQGKVLGDRNTFKKIEHLTSVPGPFWTLRSQKHEDLGWEMHSDEVLVPVIYGQGWPSDYAEGMTAVVADLRLEDVFMTEHLRGSATQDRHLTFFLAGPREMWGLQQLRVPSFTGEVKIDVRNAEIQLDESLPFDVEVCPIYFYDETSTADNYQLTTDVLTLHLKTNKSPKELSTNDFISLSKELADDLTLLVSFLSRGWVSWFRYQLVTSENTKNYIRKTRSCSTKKLRWDDGLVEHHKSRDFLRTGLRNLRELRKKGLNLVMPIVYFVSANEKKYLEEQFTTFFLSLERIKDMFAKEEKLQKNLPNAAFKKLRSSIGGLVDNEVKSSDVRDRIRTKLPELNRPSILYVLEKLFSRYGVTWQDLYPTGSQQPTLIKTRDELFHSSHEIDMDLLVRERDRLQALLERILLRMLGWDDLSRSPVELTRRWLTIPVETEPSGKKPND